jgi:hypothetical protein
MGTVLSLYASCGLKRSTTIQLSIVCSVTVAGATTAPGVGDSTPSGQAHRITGNLSRFVKHYFEERHAARIALV